MTFTPDDLNGWTGTTQWFRHWTKAILYTEGVQDFAERAGAYWFIDIVATEVVKLSEAEPFILIEMTVADGQASIRATDGNNVVIGFQRIEYTDCPPGLWRFYLVTSEMEPTLMLTSEY